MSKPTIAIFPIQNGKLITPLDANNLQIINLDTSNLGGLGGGGNDTGTTVQILKGDGNHGFADAVPGVDYATAAQIIGLELATSHDADIATVTANIVTNTSDIAALTTTVTNNNTTLTAAVATKADETALLAYVSSNDAAVGVLTTDLATLTTAVGNKADSSSVSTALAGKEPTLPTTVNDNYILARRNAGGTNAWFFVDPATLGTTSATFTDGQSFTNTNYDSPTQAQFVASDVGKAITGTDIPAGTTISSRTSGTRVVLSQATTGSHTGSTFTIINRLLSSATGTVTSVGVANNFTAGNLFDATIGTVSNPTTSATINLTPNASVGANTFYGNGAGFTNTASFMSATVARTALGGTTVGQALFQLANPSAITFPRINADNSVTALTAAGLITALGAENALTFSAPLARSTNTISIPAANTTTSGHLTAADWTSFNAKVGTARTISTTAPLTGGGDLTANRTLAIPQATSIADGYLTQGDWANFTAKPPNSRTISTTAPLTGGGDLSANRTIGIPKATSIADGYLAATDFSNFANTSPVIGLAGATGTYTVPTQTPQINRILLNQRITAPSLTIVLPAALSYLPGTFIELVDLVVDSTGPAARDFPIIIQKSGASDLIDGVTSITLARGSTYNRFNSNGGAIGRWTSTSYYTKSLTNPTNSQAIAQFNTGALTTGTRNIFVPNVDSTFMVATDQAGAASGIVLDINSDGTATKGFISENNLSPKIDPVGTIGNPLSGTHTVAAATGGQPQIDTVAINGILSSSFTLQLPNAALYGNGQEIEVIDFSGSVSTTHPVTVTSTNGTDTFNKENLSYIFDEPNGKRVFTSNGGIPTANWSVPSAKSTTTKPFNVITANSGVFTMTLDPTAAGTQNAQLTLASGANILAIPNPFDGAKIELVVIQPPSSTPGTLSLPAISAVAGTGNGLMVLTTTNPAVGSIDAIRGTYDSTLGMFLWDGARKDYTTAAVPTLPGSFAVAAGSPASSVLALTWTDSTGETSYEIQRSTDNITFVTIATSAANSTSYNDSGLAASTQYYYKIRATNAGGSSAYTASANGTTTSACSAPGVTYGSWVSTLQVCSIGNNTGTKFMAANNFVAATGDLSPCRFTSPIYKSGIPTGDLTMYIYDTTGANGTNGTPSPAATPLFTSATVPASSIINTTEGDALGTSGNPGTGPVSFSFTGVTLTVNHSYFIVIKTAIIAASPATNCYKWVDQIGQASTFWAYKSADGITWTAFGSNIKPFIKSFH